jgi:hypothetical protein
MSTLTWLHLSDLHFQETYAFDATIVLKALLKDIAERIEEDGLQPAFVVCTGDIAHGGKPGEYKLAKDFFDKLLATTNLPPERLFIVPGNHDADRGMVGDDAKALATAFDARTNANALFTNPAIRRQVLQRLDNYAAFINEYFPKEHLPFDDEHYFFIQSFKDEGTSKVVAVLGLNSAWLAYGDAQDRQRILVGEWQARAALDDEKVQGADICIALLHHPFSWLKPFDEKDVRPLLERRCDFILVGHRHEQAIQRLQEPDRDFILIPAGASYEERDKTNAYNFVRLDFAVGQGTIYLREFSPRADRWVEDTRTYGRGRCSFALPKRLMPPVHVPPERPLPQEMPAAPSLFSIYPAKGIEVVLETSVVKVIARRVEPLFNREPELELFQRILRGESSIRGVVVHSRGERGWGKSSLLIMFCQKCSECHPAFTQSFWFPAHEVLVSWESILDVTAHRLGLVHFPKYFALAQSMAYSKVGPLEMWRAVFRYGGVGVSSAEYRTGEMRVAEISMEPTAAYVPPEQFQEQLTNVFLEELGALPEPAQIAWLVDTIEATGPETQTWLSNMLGRIASQQTHEVVLVVAGKKPLPYNDAWKDKVCELDLKGLPKEAIRQIAENRGMRGTERTMDKLAELLEEKTSGNPLSICSYLDSELPRVQAERR